MAQNTVMMILGLCFQKKDLSLPEPKTEKIEVTGRNGGTVMLGWIVASLVFCGWMASAYKTGKTIIELKNQIISLSYYAGGTALSDTRTERKVWNQIKWHIYKVMVERLSPFEYMRLQEQ
ncbi:MAG: hypothetical protein ACLRMN_04910 [Mediterraneibacter gnavus]